ncbi:thymidylate synthase [Streptococcus pneumoniae]|uniref:thymidylate synthase n=1 Tax=Streptococcus pneumoniae TaxID=1313 RepID=UPI000B59774C|nr:thymidylate synthase [Streptococcus pneumoniae]
MRFSYLKYFLLNLFILNENQTRKLASGCSKQWFEVAWTDEVSKHTYGKAITNVV